MLVQKLIQHNNILNSRRNYLLKKYSKQATASETAVYERIRFPPQRARKVQTGSFINNLLLGKVDDEALMYPVVLPTDRFKDFFAWLKPIENYILSCASTNKELNKQEILSHLRECDVFQAHMEEDYGLDFTATESLKLIETVSRLPWLGTYLVKNNILPVKILSKYGSESQKQEYYPKIINGQIVPTVCINEGDNGTNVNNIKTYALPHKGDTWLLNGEKTFVINGINSNLYLVFARSVPPESFRLKPDIFSLFLVERDDKTVTCSKVYNTIGRHEVPTCTVNFKNAIIPGKNIIGKPNNALGILMELLKPGQQNIAAQAIAVLRNFIDQLVPDILEGRHFDRDLYQFDYVQSTLSEIIIALYNMESMAYFTSGLIDQYENPDVSIEQIITEKYCANKCLKSIETGMQLMGAHSYLNNTPYIQSYHDALALTTLDMNNMDANTYIGASVLKFMGETFSDHVYKKRNYVKYPIYNMMDSLLNKSEAKISLKEHFHPALFGGAGHFEDGIKVFRQCIDVLLSEQGSELMNQYNYLTKVADMVTEIYATFTCLSRSTRSYSFGLRNAILEKDISATIGYMMHRNMETVLQQIFHECYALLDKTHKATSKLAYDKRGYCMQHPLDRTL